MSKKGEPEGIVLTDERGYRWHFSDFANNVEQVLEIELENPPEGIRTGGGLHVSIEVYSESIRSFVAWGTPTQLEEWQHETLREAMTFLSDFLEAEVGNDWTEDEAE
jgi:hypothetical protein